MDLVGLKNGSREPARFFLPFCSFPCEEVARRLYLSSKHQALTRHWSIGDFLSRSERNKFVFYKLPSRQYFITVSQTKQYNPNFFTKFLFPLGYSIWHAHRQCTEVPVFLRPCQHFDDSLHNECDNSIFIHISLTCEVEYLFLALFVKMLPYDLLVSQ